ncbi:F0F1 ATP synthase subunit alpha [candidate division WWE3 bacterium]|uniref:F0F1 ATP synthase subunit alpha n=1 Tax=candidate division WWE3 bacterium TaxID=2053526 RepID=A0A955LJS8_UNCKA|nr:F0F1 ATP synthase subunit alpha [candidate division WWE3 bacterium]
MNHHTSGVSEIGHIKSYYFGVATIAGLPRVFVHEMLTFDDGTPAGVVVGYDEDNVFALMFGKVDRAQPIFRSNQLYSIPISDKLVGRVIGVQGQPLDGKTAVTANRIPVFAQAPGIIDRDPVTRPLITGIKIIDTMLPIGRGQRELIIGDRKIGKTTIAMDTVIHQGVESSPIKCIYVVCGKTAQEAEEVVRILEEHDALYYTTIVAATANDSLAAQYLAPFVGTAIGEFYRQQGWDALVVYDDLFRHAQTYRDISLLLNRAPGRESYPNDVFSLHAGLLERAGQMSVKNGGGSLTALPIMETQEGDISAFVPTNLISITDGQIYLDRGLFQKRFLPAINVGLSVSRIGGQAQPPILKLVTGGLRLALAQERELQKLTQLETEISKDAVGKIKRGELILELIKQEKHKTLTWQEQVVLFRAVEEGYFDDLEKDQWAKLEDLLLQLMRTKYKELILKIEGEKLTESISKDIEDTIAQFKREFVKNDDE